MKIEELDTFLKNLFCSNHNNNPANKNRNNDKNYDIKKNLKVL